MNRIILWVMTLFLTVLSSQAFSAFVLNGTRFIYEEGKKNISVEVVNKADATYGGQVWIRNDNESDRGVYFNPTPSFFKISGNKSQIVRIMNVNNDKLPKDRESLFFINVQEIPPADKNDGNVLAIALNTQVKLLFRPKGIIDGRENAEKQLQVTNSGGRTVIKNPTPYYFALTEVWVNGRKQTISKDVDKAMARLAPFSDVSLGKLSIGKGSKVEIEAIDDYGARNKYMLTN